MKAEEHPLSQKPLIERITPGPWKVNDDVKAKIIIYSENFQSRIALCSNVDKPVYAKESAANAEAISRVPELLKAEQENENFRKVNESQADDIIKYLRKISELEETIARKDAKLEAIREGLEEIQEADFLTIAQDKATDLISQHKQIKTS